MHCVENQRARSLAEVIMFIFFFQKDVGEIMFSLSYLSSAERLTVVVMKARNLKLAADESKLLGMLYHSR